MKSRVRSVCVFVSGEKGPRKKEWIVLVDSAPL